MDVLTINYCLHHRLNNNIAGGTLITSTAATKKSIHMLPNAQK